MRKVIDLLKKYKISVIIALSIIVVGIFGIIFLNLAINKSSIKTYENEYYSFQYDNSWSLKQKDNAKISLNHGKEAELNIEIITLENESRYASIEDLIGEIVYNIEKQNSGYKLISKKEEIISKCEFKGYKLLLESDNSQAMTSVYKKSDKLIMFNYEANNEYFDILLDSVQSMIFNFSTKEKTFDLSNKIVLDTSDISYSSDEELDKLIDKQSSYELANNHYYVKYSIPSNFELWSFESESNYFNFMGHEDKEITISSNIYKYNIFEYLDKDHTGSVYRQFNTYKDDKDYSDFVENITKVEGIRDTYIYKNSYNYNKAITYDKNFKKIEYKRKYENVMLIYALDKNHILTIHIRAVGTAITKKLIDNIKIEEIKNYSSYVTSKKIDGQLVGDLKRYIGYDKKKIEKVSLKVPDKYREFEKFNNNIYSDRYFGLNYDEDNNIYDYEIHYELTTTSSKIESKVDIINSSFSIAYGAYNYLENLGEITLNNYKFSVYTGGYTNKLGGLAIINRFKYYINKKVLFYELPNGGYLMIEISGNGKEITDEILNDATNFQINEIDN